jgi:hypothetical protein
MGQFKQAVEEFIDNNYEELREEFEQDLEKSGKPRDFDKDESMFWDFCQDAYQDYNADLMDRYRDEQIDNRMMEQMELK